MTVSELKALISKVLDEGDGESLDAARDLLDPLILGEEASSEKEKVFAFLLWKSMLVLSTERLRYSAERRVTPLKTKNSFNWPR